MFTQETLEYGEVTVHLLHFKPFDIASYDDYLLPNEIKSVHKFKHDYRKMEFVATRVLRTKIFGKVVINYNEIGVPSIEGQYHISISHSSGVVGIASCSKFMVGLDLEPIRPKVLRVKHKFLSEEEKVLLDTSSEGIMTKVWSGKEALYKLAKRKGIIFAENLHLKPLEDDCWEGRITFPEWTKTTKMCLDKKENFIVSINIKPLC